MKVNFFLVFFCSFLFTACHYGKHELAFNLDDQIFYSCNSSPIGNLSIKNDSITIKGFPVEGGMLIFWNGAAGVTIPNELDLTNIPPEYEISQGGRNYKGYKYLFKPNSRYTVKKFGSGKTEFYLKLWTDSTGKVYKTTHPKCGLKSLESDEEMYKGS